VRSDLAAGDPGDLGDPIARFIHLTDLHVTDAQSPARFEFVNHLERDSRFRELLTMQRPQEMLNMHAVAAMIQTINGLDAPDLVAVTGDGIDNTQHNELMNLVALLDGGQVRPDSGAPGYEGVQRADWPDEIFWKPDGPRDGDRFQRELGFPQRPGLLAEAVLPFRSDGLRVPWLRCWGNHEQVCQGVGMVTAAVGRAMGGPNKPVEMPLDIDPDHAVDTFVEHAELYMTGASRSVTPDAGRRPISRSELLPAADHVYESGPVRFVVLDTVCDAGGADGTLSLGQLEWLQEQLVGAGDRYVILLSHHGYDTMWNPRGERRADELLTLLHRHSQVVLWLNGHIHANRITPRGTFWEVTTSSLVDWPCQTRLVELYRFGGDLLAILCTMVDHDGTGLAALHRELAANVPANGFGSWRSGSPGDRNVVLLLPDPS
jgi:3',5'-cyclic AMP phosphodiesterase CpdA